MKTQTSLVEAQGSEPKRGSREEMLYESVLRMVIWDEDKLAVFRMLEVNGIDGDTAQKMYQRARADRIATIRTDSWREAFVGLFWLIAGIGTFSFFWFGLHFITKGVLILTGLAAVRGLWKLIQGLVGVIFAPTKKGSLAN